MNFEKFNEEFDVSVLAQQVASIKKNSKKGDYAEVPCGTYEVKITKLELKESKKGDPMVTVWFKIIAGQYKGSGLFMNQVITKDFQIKIVNDFLRSLNSGIEVSFEDFEQYNQLLLDIAEAINGKFEYALYYGLNKGFHTFKITEVFNVDQSLF